MSAEEVAKAFLHSVDRYMEVNEDQPTVFDTSKLVMIKNVKLPICYNKL